MPRHAQSLATIHGQIDPIEAEPNVGDGLRRTSCHMKGHTMKLLNIFKAFKKDESGAVTVDWVVLTAAIVGLGMVVMTSVGGSITGLAGEIATDLDARNAGYENQ
jgi:Flp pilus assembly pilin Flp